MKTALLFVFFSWNIFLYAQHNKPVSISLLAGTTTPTDTYENSKTSFNTGLNFHFPVAKKAGIHLSADYGNFQAPDQSSFNKYGFSVAPTYKIGTGKWDVKLFTGLGYGKIDLDNYLVTYPNTDLSVNKLDVLQQSFWQWNTGVKISYPIGQNWTIASNLQYSKGLNDSFVYASRDLSPAVAGDRIDYEMAADIPFQTQSTALSNIKFQVGIGYQIFSKSSKSSSTSSSSKFQENDPPGVNPTLAQDWNSSRSNKTSNTARVSNPDDEPSQGNENPAPALAQDWNSSRSNKTSKIARIANPEGEGNNNPAYAPIEDENPGVPETAALWGKRKAKKECLEAGGTFWEKADGSYFCMKHLSISRMAGDNDDPGELESKKRKCWKEGGTWVITSAGVSYCWPNPNRRQTGDSTKRGHTPFHNKYRPQFKEGAPTGNTATENSNAKKQEEKERAKKHCLASGDYFAENPDGTFICLKTSKSSSTSSSSKRNGSDSSPEILESKKRKCWKSGGTWVTPPNSPPYCWPNPNK